MPLKSALDIWNEDKTIDSSRRALEIWNEPSEPIPTQISKTPIEEMDVDKFTQIYLPPEFRTEPFLKIATPEEFFKREEEIKKMLREIPEGVKGLGAILKGGRKFLRRVGQQRRGEAVEPFYPDEKKQMLQGLQFAGNVVNEFFWRPLTGWYQSMLKEVSHRQYKREDYIAGKAGFQALPRAMARGLLGIEDVEGKEILEAGGIPKTEDIILEHPALATAKEVWGATLDVLPLPILRPIATVNKMLQEGKYAAADKLAGEVSETIAKTRYEQMGNPLGKTWEELPTQTRNVAMKMCGEVPIKQLSNKSIADIFYEHPYKAWQVVAKKGFVGQAGVAKIPFKVGDTVKFGEQIGKITSIEGTKAVIGVAGKQIATTLAKLKPITPAPTPTPKPTPFVPSKPTEIVKKPIKIVEPKKPLFAKGQLEEQRLLEFQKTIKGEGFTAIPSTPELRKFIRGLPENIQKRDAIAQYEKLQKQLGKPLAKAKVKPLVREITSQTIKVADLFKEEITWREALKIESQIAKKTYKLAKGETLEKVRVHIAEVKARAKERETLREETKKFLKTIHDVDTSKMSPAHANTIKEIQESVDFTKPTKKTFARLLGTRQYLETNLEAEVPDYVYEDLKRLEKLNRDTMTLDQLRSMASAVAHHAHLEKVKKTIRVGREIKKAHEVLESSVNEMKPPAKIKSDIVSSQKGKAGKIKHAGRLIKDTFGIRHDHYDLVVESLAGINSTMDRVLYQGVKEGIKDQLAYRQKTFGQFQKDLNLENFQKKHKIKDIAAWQNERVQVGKFDLSKGEKMSLYRHTLNENNLRHIIEGGFGFKFGKDPTRVYRITEEELNAVLKSLTDAEKEFAGKSVTNLFDNQHEALSKIFYEKNGYLLPKEIDYYPIDVMKTTLPSQLERESTLEELKHKFIRVGLKKGMLIDRKKSKLPIFLNSIAYDINKSVMNSAAYVGLEIPLTNASRLLYNRNFKAAIFNRYGFQTWKELEKGLRDIAGDWQSYTTVQELLMLAKNNLTTAILGINPFVMLKQFLSYSLYNAYIKPQYLIQGFIDHVVHPLDLLERHKMYSPELVERVAGGYSRDVADVFKSGAEKRLYAGKKSVKEGLMGGIKLFDINAVSPGMQSAVLQVLDEIEAGKFSLEVAKALDMKTIDPTKISPEDKMKLAYKFADWCTQRTQPMFSPEHRSSLSRGATVEKLATQFSSFTNQALNLIRRTWREALRTGDPKIYAKLGKVLFLLLVVNTGGVFVIDSIRDRIYKRKQRRGFGEAILDSVASYFYFIRDLERSVVSKVKMGTWRGYDISIPVWGAANTFGDVIADGIGALTEKSYTKRKKRAASFMDNALEIFLMLNGIPYKTPKKIITRGGKKRKSAVEIWNKPSKQSEKSDALSIWMKE